MQMAQRVTLQVLGTTTSSATTAVAILVLNKAYWRFSFAPRDIYIDKRDWLGIKNQKGGFFRVRVMLNVCRESVGRKVSRK
jgi:hypothetical protein